MSLRDAVLASVDAYRRPDGSINVTALAGHLGLRRTSLQRVLKRLARDGRLGTKPVLPGFGIKETSTNGKTTWVRQAPLGDKLEVQEGEVYKERSVLTDGDLNTKLIWHKLKQDTPEVALTKDAIREMFAEYRGKAEFIDSPSAVDLDLLTLYPTADVHLGMLAWGKETGTAWDLPIARDTLLRSTSQLIQCSPASHTAIFLDLGDWMHANDQKNATPQSGHQLDVDGRFPKVAKEAVKIRREMIELALQKHEIVIYRGLPGNHDPEAQQWLTIAMSLFFDGNPRVIVDDDPGDFWFYQHGAVMLAGNHGHKMKPDLLPGIMASYQPRMWGNTRHRFAFSGHIHHERSGTDRAGGARWETLRTIAPPDAFAHSHGFRDRRELTSITYSAERGQRLRQFMPV